MEKIQKENILLHHFLQEVCKNGTGVSIYLRNGIKLEGCITQFDFYTLLLEGRGVPSQIVFKRAISTIMLSGGEVVSLKKINKNA